MFCRLEVAPNSEATVDVLFRPVIVGSGEAKLSLSHPAFYSLGRGAHVSSTSLCPLAHSA